MIKKLFAISLITFCAAVYLAIPNMPFLLKGSFGEAEIGKKLATTSEYTVYQAKLQLSRMDAKQGKITSDRSNLKMGDIIPVFYRRDEHSKMLAIELFEVRTAIGARWNAAATVDLAIWIIFGPAWVMLVELVAVPIGDGVVKRQPPIKVIFNACSNSLAAGLAGVTYMLIPGSEDLTTPIFLVGAVVSLFVFSAMNHLVTGMIIAIDGPAGAGKSTVARHLAEALIAPVSAA